jgi:WD40 repeat protein
MLACTCSNTLSFLSDVDLSIMNSVRLSGEADELTCVKFSPDGRLAFTESEDEYIRVWEPETGKLVNRIHTGFIPTFEWTVMKNLNLVLVYREEARIINYATGKTISTIYNKLTDRSHATRVFCSDDCLFIVRKNSTTVYSILNYEYIVELNCYCSSVSFDGRFVTYQHDGRVKGVPHEIGVIEVGPWATIWSRPMSVGDAQFSQDGLLVAKNNTVNSVSVLNPVDGSTFSEFQLRNGTPWDAFVLTPTRIVVFNSCGINVYSMTGELIAERIGSFSSMSSRYEPVTVLM